MALIYGTLTDGGACSQANLGNRSIPVPRGHVLGGSSSISEFLLVFSSFDLLTNCDSSQMGCGTPVDLRRIMTVGLES